MATLIVITRRGKERAVTALVGQSLMVNLRDNGFDEVEALCGGNCACATCHVYIDPTFAARLRPLKSDEDDLLACSDHRTPQSRLSCQVPFTEDLDGLRLTIAPED